MNGEFSGIAIFFELIIYLLYDICYITYMTVPLKKMSAILIFV